MLPHLILLPGLHGTSELYSRVVNRLDGHPHTTVSFPRDRITPVEERLEQVRAALPEGPVLVVGESWSGGLAVRLAHAEPERVVGLALMASFVRPPRRIPASLVPSLPFRFRPPAPFMRRFMLGPNCRDALVEEVTQVLSGIAPAVLVARARECLTADVSQLLSEVTAPLFVVRAAKDQIVPADASEHIRSLRPDAEVAAIVGPHLIQQRRPRETVHAITTWWGLVESQRAIEASPGVGSPVGR